MAGHAAIAKRCACVAAVLSCAWGGPLSARTVQWVGEDGSWSSNLNWDWLEPTASDTAIVNNAGSVTIDLPGEVATSLILGDDHAGSLSIVQGGVLDTIDSRIGSRVGATGWATVTGPGSLWDNNNTLYVGGDGSGTLDILAGGVVETHRARIAGLSVASGQVNIQGPGARFDVQTDLLLGIRGQGTMRIESAGAATAHDGEIASISGSVGLAVVTGMDSSWHLTGILDVGNHGDGTLRVELGASVSSSHAFIGHETGATGAAVVRDSGSTWTTTGDLFVGYRGRGALSIQDGGLVDVQGSVFFDRLGGADGLHLSLAAVADPLLDVAGDASLAGTLDVALAGDATFADGDTFTLIDIGGQQSGGFTNAEEQDLLYARGGLAWRLTYFGGDGNDVELTAEDWTAGDLSGDGFVGAEDLGILLANWGDSTFAYHAHGGDLSGDGVVGQDDLQIVIDNWGNGTPPGINIPEPGTLAIVGLAGMALLRPKR